MERPGRNNLMRNARMADGCACVERLLSRIVSKGKGYGFKEIKKGNLWFVDSGIYSIGMCFCTGRFSRVVPLWLYGTDGNIRCLYSTILEMPALWEASGKTR